MVGGIGNYLIKFTDTSIKSTEIRKIQFNSLSNMFDECKDHNYDAANVIVMIYFFVGSSLTDVGCS